ncbi:carboxymuconolactone decarboxylase family protein [Bordetella petrii]|uniref:carboxymuconolactone decarboxylase family protein n=1 Tax=Bordetella petrii TaxID=94624 RepID=UPI001E3EAFA7|nr:carboxymuconolactone decarboxylase family protein [Bordetella petrii]MCD0504073.1 carboxymuconolactone decarboxylase family protein [Bordetella petrii]
MTQDTPQYRRNENFDKGLEIRQALLGKEKIDTALWGADAFNQPMQQLTTEYCWGEIWGRPGLPRKVRSLLNIAMLSALNRSKELELHVRAALGNDCSPEEIQEALLQAAVYAGVPAGVEGFRVATPVIRQYLEERQQEAQP